MVFHWNIIASQRRRRNVDICAIAKGHSLQARSRSGKSELPEEHGCNNRSFFSMTRNCPRGAREIAYQKRIKRSIKLVHVRGRVYTLELVRDRGEKREIIGNRELPAAGNDRGTRAETRSRIVEIDNREEVTRAEWIMYLAETMEHGDVLWLPSLFSGFGTCSNVVTVD